MAFGKLERSAETRSATSRGAQAKGARGEREVLQAIRDVMVNTEDALIERGYTVQARSTGAIRRRLEIGKSREDISGVPLISIEVKRNEALNPDRAWEQAVRQADKRLPVLCYRYNREAWKVRTWVALPAINGRILKYTTADLSLPDFLSYYALLYSAFLIDGLADTHG